MHFIHRLFRDIQERLMSLMPKTREQKRKEQVDLIRRYAVQEQERIRLGNLQRKRQQAKEQRFKKKLEIHLDVLKQHKLINKVTVDQNDRIHITTGILYVQLKKVNRIIGKFEIMIDYNNSYKSVRILNLSQRFERTDNPHIQDTHPCWGNIEDEIHQLLTRRDLLSLIDTILYYIVSSKDLDGYTQWAYWLSHAKPVKIGYSIEKYDAGMNDLQVAPGINVPLRQQQENARYHQAATRDANGGYPI